MSNKITKGSFERHKRERVIQSHSDSDKCIFESIHFHPTFQAVLTQSNCTFSKTVRPWLVVPKSEFGSFHHDKIRTNKRSVGGYFDRGNVHHGAMAFFLILWQVREFSESNDVCSIAHQFLCCSVLAKHHPMSQVTNQAENVCVLDNHLTLEHLSNNEFVCTQGKRDLPAGVLFDQQAEGYFLQVDTSSQILRIQRVCEAISSFRRRIGEDARGRSSRLLRFSFVIKRGAMNKPDAKFTKR